jgi:hypothetical protein
MQKKSIRQKIMSLYQNKEIVPFTLLPNFSDARKWKGNFTADQHEALNPREIYQL